MRLTGVKPSTVASMLLIAEMAKNDVPYGDQRPFHCITVEGKAYWYHARTGRWEEA